MQGLLRFITQRCLQGDDPIFSLSDAKSAFLVTLANTYFYNSHGSPTEHSHSKIATAERLQSDPTHSFRANRFHGQPWEHGAPFESSRETTTTTTTTTQWLPTRRTAAMLSLWRCCGVSVLGSLLPLSASADCESESTVCECGRGKPL